MFHRKTGSNEIRQSYSRLSRDCASSLFNRSCCPLLLLLLPQLQLQLQLATKPLTYIIYPLPMYSVPFLLRGNPS